MAIEIRIDPAELDEAMRRMEGIPYALQRAVYPAVAEVLDGVRDDIAKHVKSDVPLPDKIAKKAIRLSMPRMSGGTVVGEVSVGSATVPLIHYDVQPQAITARPGVCSKQWPGFTYALRTGERRQSSERGQGVGLPFIARMPSGHVGVYYRTTSQMKQAYGPTVQYHVATPEVEQKVIDRANTDFPIVLARYVDQAIATHGGAS